jgi:predicted ATP-binding protein involved in virulence
MKIKKLEIANLRAFTHAEFAFQPGMNLLVGINGVGKTTVLDALRISLSKVLPDLFGIKGSKQSFDQSDIRIGSQSLQVSCDFIYNQLSFNLLFKKQLGKVLYKDPSIVRDQLSEAPDIENITPELHGLFPTSKSAESKPLFIFFSTKRSILTNKQASGSAVAGGQAAAFSESLLERETNLRTIAEWYKVQEELGDEKPIGLKHNAVLRDAIETFLPGFRNLRVVVSDGKPLFVINKNATTLNLTQLSDGERGLLAMVLDLARRLSQANPELVNPLEEGSAIVLIDELDLHLHPKWQRTIIGNLIRTFPNCQFIATTHSPQIIPSAEPEQVFLLKDNEIIRPDRTLGMDSNWILKFIMDADDRPKDALTAIEIVENLINEGKFKEARGCIIHYKNENLDLVEWPIFEARMARMEILSKGK